MAKKICIQSGHWNTTNGQTGAPQELVRTLAIGLRLVDLLRANGFEVYHTDANGDRNPAVTQPDWDLFLALHCDANYAGDEGGAFFDWIDPSIDSSVESNNESKRIMEAMESVYFSDAGVRDMPNRRNANTKFYYMWRALSANTHCVLVEMGESIDPHDNVILNDTDRVAKALLHGIMKAFNVSPSPEPQPTTQPPIDYKKLYDDTLKEYTEYKKTYSATPIMVEEARQSGRIGMRNDVINLVNKLS